MSHFERSGMVAAHSGESRRIVVGRLLGRQFLRGSALRKEHGPGSASADSVHEIAPGNFPAHAKIAIASVQMGLLGSELMRRRIFCKIALFG
jgi:hypothetical protein